MNDPQRILEEAKEALARSKEAKTKVNPRLLVRFEKKIRLTESALTTRRGGATGAGLRDVLARAEARAAAKVLTSIQEHALGVLRAEVARLEGEGAESTKAVELVKSLASDTERMRALATPPKKGPPKKGNGNGKKAKKVAKPPKKGKKPVDA